MTRFGTTRWLAGMAAAMFLPMTAHAQDEIRTTHDGLQGELAGTVQGTLSGDGPVVLIHPGSGPTDRDGNSPLGVTGSTYRLLAEGLEARGISSVRIDKRGMFESAAAWPNANDVTVEAYAQDIAAWADTITQQGGAECVWLLGHSEGGMHVLAAANADPARYCGVLLVASVGRPLAETIRDQIANAPGAAPLLPQVDDIMARITAGETVPASEMHPGLTGLFGPQVQPFLTSLFNNNPAQLVAALEMPVLILNGREDLQTTEDDALALAEAQPDARLILLDATNHLLKEVPEGDRAANLATYANPDLPLNPAAIDAIADFVLEER